MKLCTNIWMFILILLVGCQNESGVNTIQSNYSFFASIENTETDSRTAVDDAGKVTWAVNDALGVFGSVTPNVKFVSKGSGASVVFEGTLPEDEEVKCVYYPFDETATLEGSKLTFTLSDTYTYTGASQAPMLGVKSGDKSYNFKHLCGLMRVNILGVPEGTSTFTLMSEGNDAPDIAGKAAVNDVNAQDAVLELKDNLSKKVTVTITVDETTDATLYIPLPVGTYAKLSAKYMNGTTEIFNKSTSDVTIGRGTLLDMPVVVTVEKYLDEVDAYVKSLDLDNLDYDGLKANLSSWLENEDFVKEVEVVSGDCYDEIEFTAQGGMKGSVILSKNESGDENSNSRSRGSMEVSDNGGPVAIKVSKVSGENYFQNTNVKSYSFAYMLTGEEQEVYFEKALVSTPVNLVPHKLSHRMNAINELLNDPVNYSVELLTGTHGVEHEYEGYPTGAFWVLWEGNCDYIHKNHMEKMALWYDFNDGEGHTQWWNVYGKYIAVLPRFFFDNKIFDDNALVYGSYCYASGEWKDYSLMNLNNNFLGYINTSYSFENEDDIFFFFDKIFNGYTVNDAYNLTKDEYWQWGELLYNEKKPNQRYFSVMTYLNRVNGCYALVNAQIFGWNNLKGFLLQYKKDELNYKVYYSDTPFESPTDANVRSQEIGWGQVAPDGTVIGHYDVLDDNRDVLMMQCLIKASNTIGKTCYFTLGFEYIDPNGNKKIYYGDIQTYVTRPEASRSVESNDSSFASFDAASIGR